MKTVPANLSVSFCVVLLFLCLSSLGRAEEEVLYWNIARFGGYTRLYPGGEKVAEELTDSAYLPFSCAPKSGMISVHGVVSDPLRAKMAEAITSDDVPPNVMFVPPTGAQNTYYLDLTYSGMDGWVFSFEIIADDPYFQTFRRTGRFVFEVAGVRHEIFSRPMKRIENVGKFIDECKKRKGRS